MPQQINEDQVKNLGTDLAAKAPLASPALTGIPTAPTAAAGTNTTQIATTAFVEAALAGGTSGITQLTGDVTAGPGSGSQAATLAASGVTAGSYGNPTAISVDSKGRVTAINGGSSFVSPYVSSAFNTANAGVSSLAATLNPGGPGNTVIVFVAMTNTADYPHLTISGGGVTWTLIGSNSGAASVMYLASGISGSVTVSANFSSATTGTVGLAVVARSGILTASPSDGTSLFYTYFGGTSESTGPVTTANANDVLVAFGYGTSTGTATITGTGFTTDAATTSGPPMAIGSATVSATGTYSATATFSASQSALLTGIAALKLAGTGAGTVTSFNGRTGAVVAATGDYTDAQIAFSDNTTNNASTSAHGYAPKLPGDATKYLDGSGGFSTPPGSSGITLTTTGSSGAATLSGGTLNIPVYSGGGGGALTLISSQVLASSAASVTFSSIAGSFSHLRLVCMGRTATNASSFDVQFNGDTGANYDVQALSASNTTPTASSSAGNTFIYLGSLPGSSAPTGQAGSTDIMIYNYAGTTFWKQATSQSFRKDSNAQTGFALGVYGGTWRSTSAITSITIKTDSGAGNFIAGSVFTLYGIS